MKKLLLLFVFITLTISIQAAPIFGTVCIKGYLFAWAKSTPNEREGISLVQILDYSPYLGGPQPIKCK